MLIKMMNNILMDAATEPTQGGGGGGAANGSFLTPPTGGGGTPPNSPDAGASSGANSEKPPGNAGTNPPAGGNSPSDWRSQLPQGLQEDPSIKKFNTVDALAGAYLNAQRHLGADKIAIPGKHATPDDWKNVYHKLGLPETPDKYEVKFKESVTLNDEFQKTFKEQAYQAGVLPQQAQKIAEWFSDMNLKAEDAIKAEQNKNFQAAQANLQKDWGQGYQLKVARAMKVVEDHGGAELIQHLNAIGVGTDEKTIRFLATLGDKLYAEHKIVTTDGNLSNGMTPKEMQDSIAKLQKEPAYFDKMHPNHKAVVKEVQDLFSQLYPKK